MTTQLDKIALLYVPCGSEEEAANIARSLISDCLIACGNIHASRSLYRWEGKLADEVEYVLIAKTTAELASSAAHRINELHSYNVPCVLTIEPDAVSEPYRSWVVDQVSSSTARRPPEIGASDTIERR